MSLIVSNKLTDKQRAQLIKLEYIGTFDLTIEQAAEIIDELFEEQRLFYRDFDATEADIY
jgi:hypothetical protein